MAVIERILLTTRGSEVKLCAPVSKITCSSVDVIRGDPRAAPTIVVLYADSMPSTEEVLAPLVISGRLLQLLELLSDGCLLKSLFLEGLTCL